MEATSPSTSVSLLRKVQRGEARAWDQFATLYLPLVYRWVRASGLQEVDARDVCQNVFLSVVQKVGHFRTEEVGSSLRGWLRTITKNATIDLYRQQGRQVPAIADNHPAWNEMTLDSLHLQSGELDERTWLIHRAAEVVQRELEPSTWQMFQELTIEGRSAEQVAQARKLSVWAVYKARTRVLAKFRELLSDEL